MAGKLFWDERLGRYRNSRGQFVSDLALRTVLDRTLDKAAREAVSVSRDLWNDKIRLAEWQLTLEREIKNAHLAAAALARGGWEFLTPSDYGRVGAIVKGEYKYLRRFAQQLRDGLVLNGSFYTRVESYIEGGRETFTLFDRDEKIKRGFTEERNVLGVAEHCTECKGLTEKGWVKIGTLPPTGRRICLHKCKCRIIYRKKPPTPKKGKKKAKG